MTMISSEGLRSTFGKQTLRANTVHNQFPALVGATPTQHAGEGTVIINFSTTEAQKLHGKRIPFEVGDGATTLTSDPVIISRLELPGMPGTVYEAFSLPPWITISIPAIWPLVVTIINERGTIMGEDRIHVGKPRVAFRDLPPGRYTAIFDHQAEPKAEPKVVQGNSEKSRDRARRAREEAIAQARAREAEHAQQARPAEPVFPQATTRRTDWTYGDPAELHEALAAKGVVSPTPGPHRPYTNAQLTGPEASAAAHAIAEHISQQVTAADTALSLADNIGEIIGDTDDPYGGIEAQLRQDAGLPPAPVVITTEDQQKVEAFCLSLNRELKEEPFLANDTGMLAMSSTGGLDIKRAPEGRAGPFFKLTLYVSARLDHLLFQGAQLVLYDTTYYRVQGMGYYDPGLKGFLVEYGQLPPNRKFIAAVIPPLGEEAVPGDDLAAIRSRIYTE